MNSNKKGFDATASCRRFVKEERKAALILHKED
jgi:hypothetical protein